MKKQHLLLAALAAVVVGCTDDQFEGQQQGNVAGGMCAIHFGTAQEAVTRADKTGKDAAELLNNNFIVEGFKSKGSDATPTATLNSPVEVFRYYNVNYYDGTAYSTESNSHGWEYVAQTTINKTEGKIDVYQSGDATQGITPIASQTIKYWDTDYAQYDFVAFSQGVGDTVTTPGTKTYAKFSEVDSSKIGTEDAVYTIKGSVKELGSAYVADLVTVYNNDNKTAFLSSSPVTPHFRKLAAKIRMAIYETVPGYSVKDVRFYQDAATAKYSTTDVSTGSKLKGNLPTLFTDEAIIPSGSGSIEVSFPVAGKSNQEAEGYNKAQVKFTGTESSDLTTMLVFEKKLQASAAKESHEDVTATDTLIGRTSSTATYAGDYIDVIPTGEGHVLNLRVAYTLVPIDGGEEVIVMEDATAVVPAQFAEWQPNYAYTYIFKISEKTGEGLYPITFDALVMDCEDGIQETITEVSDPSITTYQNGRNVTENDEYIIGDSIFVVVDNGKALSKTDDGVGYVRLFNAVLTPAESATSPNAATALQSITEATAENCFEHGTYDETGKTWTVTDAAGATLVLTDATEGLDIQKQIGADHTTNGLTWTINNAQFLPAEVGYYVFQYETEAAVSYEDEIEYNDAKGTNLSGTEFEELTDAEKIKTPAKYMYKVIKVVEEQSNTSITAKDEVTDKQFGKKIR